MAETALPEAVLTNLVQLANGAVEAYDASLGDEDGFDMEAALRRALKLVLPLYGQWLRGQISDEIPTFYCPYHDTVVGPRFDPECPGCQRHAALVGACQIVLGRDSPSARVVRERRMLTKNAEGKLNG